MSACGAYACGVYPASIRALQFVDRTLPALPITGAGCSIPTQSWLSRRDGVVSGITKKRCSRGSPCLLVEIVYIRHLERSRIRSRQEHTHNVHLRLLLPNIVCTAGRTTKRHAAYHSHGDRRTTKVKRINFHSREGNYLEEKGDNYM